MVTTNQKPIIHTKRKNPGVKLKPSITKRAREETGLRTKKTLETINKMK